MTKFCSKHHKTRLIRLDKHHKPYCPRCASKPTQAEESGGKLSEDIVNES